MRKNLSVTAAVAFLALIVVLVPVAVAGSNPPTIREYQNDKGNKIISVRFDELFFVTGDKLNTFEQLQCYAGKINGKKQWVAMDYETISSKLLEALPSEACAGFTGPVRLFYTETSYVVGPDLTITGNPIT